MAGLVSASPQGQAGGGTAFVCWEPPPENFSLVTGTPANKTGRGPGAFGLVPRMFGKFGDYQTHLMGGAVAKRFAGRAVTPSPSFHPGGDGLTRPRKLKLP